MNIFTISYLYMEGNENQIPQLKRARDNWQIAKFRGKIL